MGRIAHRYPYPPIASHPIASHHRTLARRARRHTQHPPASTRRSWHGPTRDTACGIRQRAPPPPLLRARCTPTHPHIAQPRRSVPIPHLQSRVSKAAPAKATHVPKAASIAAPKPTKPKQKNKTPNSPITHRPRAHRARTPLLHALPVFIPPHHPALAADALPRTISSGEGDRGRGGGGGRGERVERGGGGDTCYFLK